MRARQRVQRHCRPVPCSRDPRHGLSHAWNLLKLIPRSRVEKRRSGLNKHTFAENGSGFDEQGVNKGEQEDAGRAEGGHAAQKGCRALPCRVIAPDRASRPAPTDLTLVRLRRLSRGATVNGSPQHRRSSAAIEDWPVHGCCASPGTARTWRTTPQASCSDSVQEVPGGGNRVQRRERALNRPSWA